MGLGTVDDVIRAGTNVIQSSNLDGLTILRKEDLDAQRGHSYHRSYCDNDVRMANSQRTRSTCTRGRCGSIAKGAAVAREDGGRGSRSGSDRTRGDVRSRTTASAPRGVSHQIDVHRVRGDSRFRAASRFAPPVPSGPRGKGTHVKVKAAVLREVTKGYSIEELELEPPKAGEALVKYAYTGYCHSDLSNMMGRTSHGAAHGGRPRVRRRRRGRRRGRHQGQGRRPRASARG